MLCATLDSTSVMSSGSLPSSPTFKFPLDETPNLFISYLSRIHRDEDFSVLLKGFCRLLNNPLIQTYLPGSCKKIGVYQELLILFWKFCDRNKVRLTLSAHCLNAVWFRNSCTTSWNPVKYWMFSYLFSTFSTMLVQTPVRIRIVFIEQKKENFDFLAKIGLMHIGIFILLLLSGERNFGVRLNKPYVTRVPMDIPVFTGTHADLLIIVRDDRQKRLLSIWVSVLVGFP